MSNNKPNKGLNMSLWVAQGLTAATFLMAGTSKVGQAISALAAMYPWTGEVPEPMVRVLGFFDLMGGIGLVLPALLRIKPSLTIWAAYGSILLMVSAIVFHLMRGEANVVGFNFILLVLLGFIAWGRAHKAPIPAR